MDFENKFIYLKKTITNLEKERRKEQRKKERKEKKKINMDEKRVCYHS